MKTITTKCVNGDLQVGDLVISTPTDEYSCLIGRVLAINLLGTPEHDVETSNETDDVHVSFIAYDYGKKRIREIEKDFSDMYEEKKTFDECPLDDVIMAPDSLIRINGIDDGLLNGLLESGYNAACYCYETLQKVTERIGSVVILPCNSQQDIKQDLMDTIESSVTLAGYEVLDGDRDSFIVRHGKSDTDYEIKVTEQVG